MPNFAVVENNIVTNVIIADSLESAEYASGKTCIEYTDTFPAGIGWTWDGSRFIYPKPHNGWILNANFEWEPPFEYPKDGKKYKWDDDLINWVEIVTE